MNSHLLYLLASTDWRLIRFALLSREYWREYHPAIIHQYYRSEIIARSCQRWGYKLGDNFILHRDKGPAVVWSGTILPNKIIWQIDNISGYENGEIWFQNGLGHRTDGPAVSAHNDNKRVQIWLVRGEYHRKRGPARIIIANPDKITYFIRIEEWYWHNEFHRNETGRNCGPAITEIGSDYREEYYYRFGSRHRDEGPATLRYKCRNGKMILSSQSWWKQGQLDLV